MDKGGGQDNKPPASAVVPQKPIPGPVISVDPASPGLTFAGLGALSAGAASLLLQHYPEQQRNEILDLLFKPGCGAAYQHLKVEIGGDINSTDGTEPSHARTREEMENPKPEYFNRGYEWWLMKEAKKRNPDIKLHILEWGAPGWIGSRPEPARKRTALAEKNIQWFFDEIADKRWHQPYFPERWRRFYSQDNADYIAAYILGLKKHHDLTIDYCGIWNETHYDATWIKLLRRTLDARGLQHVKITAADQCMNKRWDISDEMLEDPELMNIVSDIGAHYPGWGMPTTNAWKTGKPLTASEECDWGGLDWGGALGYARTFNCNYINGRMTRSIVWNAVVSYYDMLPAPGRGTMRASQPWSGHYQMSPGLWAFAHTTQFSMPGWRYLDSGCGIIDGTSYVTVCDPAQPGRFSIVVESSKSKGPQNFRIKLADAVATNRLHLWRSTAREPLSRQNDLVRQTGDFVLDVEPHCIYTVTTTEGQGKGTFTPPPPQRLPFPFAEDFEKSEESRAPLYFADLGGAFEVAQRPDGNGKCIKQVITQRGIDWLWVTPGVLSIVGDSAWKDYRVSCDARSDGGGGMVALYGRLGSVGLAQNYESFPIRSYALELLDSGMWRLKTGQRILKEGILKTNAANVWRRLELEFAGTHIVARIDGDMLADLVDTSCKAGMIGVGSGYHQAWFDNLKVTPVAAGAGRLPELKESGSCRSLEYTGQMVQEPGWHFWGCSTIVGAEGREHPFVEWRTAQPRDFDAAWRRDSEIANCIGDTPERPFRLRKVALKGAGTNTWDPFAPANPCIQKVDGEYMLVNIGNPIGMTQGGEGR
ncbi:MAG: family 16 glycoside hydrolase [Kiritimatiellia bacterium]